MKRTQGIPDDVAQSIAACCIQIDDIKIRPGPNLKQKFEVLYDLATQSSIEWLPRSRIELAADLQKILPLLNSQFNKVDSGALGKIEDGDRQFSMRVHAALIAIFGLAWPFPTYIDIDNLNRDIDISDFRSEVFKHSGGIRIRRFGRNQPDFANEELFVSELVDQSNSSAYLGKLIAKLGRRPIKETEGDQMGKLLGYAGFPVFSITVRVPDGADIKCLRPNEMESQKPKHIEIRARHSNPDQRYSVRLVSQFSDSKIPFFDENIDIAFLAISALDYGQVVKIIYSAPLPDLTPHIDDTRVAEPARAELSNRISLLARNQVLEDFRRGEGSVEAPQDLLTIGEVHFKREEN